MANRLTRFPALPTPAASPAPAAFLRAILAARPALSSETLALLISVLMAATFNIPFWRLALAGREAWSLPTWHFATATFLILASLLFLPSMLVGTRALMRPLLAVSLVSAAAGQYFMMHYGVVLDTDMVRNAIQTNPAEAREYLGWDLVLWMAAFGALPAMALFRLELRRRPWRQALRRRLTIIAAGLAVLAVATVSIYQDLASVLRNRQELRLTINPISPLWSAARALLRDSRQAGLAHAPTEPAWRTVKASLGHRPLLLVIVVGETARADNFSLLGYGRLTNPRLAGEDLIAYRDAHSCGTATLVSLPCMFSPYGRADYDEALIHSHDSALQVLAHAGIDIAWLDNQSGCKGVCDGLFYVNAQTFATPGQCAQSECQDEVLLHALDGVDISRGRDQVVVLHQLGNHGPAYHRRYPKAFNHFRPACESDELRDCSREEIVNAYDNAILYTDHFLTEVIKRLRGLQTGHDVAMLYISDHGESLGEHGLYLHGMPYPIAPEVQTHVPMLWWLPPSTAQVLGVDIDCLKRGARARVSHDNLYHSLMGLLAVHTAPYHRERDLFAACPADPATRVTGTAPLNQGNRRM